jgi:hypothetical protein
MGLQRKLSCRAPCPGATAEVIVCPGHLDLSALNDRMCDIGQSKPGRLAYVGKASRLTSFVVSWLKRFYLAKADRRLRHERRDPGVPTRASCSSGPGDKSPGYCHMSLRGRRTISKKTNCATTERSGDALLTWPSCVFPTTHRLPASWPALPLGKKHLGIPSSGDYRLPERHYSPPHNRLKSGAIGPGRSQR